MFIDRALESIVIEMSNTFPVVLVTGPRQVGKTTLLETIAEEGRNYISLDEPVARQLANDDPLLFLQRYEPLIIIDEIQ